MSCSTLSRPPWATVHRPEAGSSAVKRGIGKGANRSLGCGNLAVSVRGWRKIGFAGVAASDLTPSRLWPKDAQAYRATGRPPLPLTLASASTVGATWRVSTSYKRPPLAVRPPLLLNFTQWRGSSSSNSCRESLCTQTRAACQQRPVSAAQTRAVPAVAAATPNSVALTYVSLPPVRLSREQQWQSTGEQRDSRLER
jgi:hypothetical protein